MWTGPVVTEVRMGQGSLGGDPSLGIKQQHFLKKERKSNYFVFFCFLICSPPAGLAPAGQSPGRAVQCSWAAGSRSCSSARASPPARPRLVESRGAGRSWRAGQSRTSRGTGETCGRAQQRCSRRTRYPPGWRMLCPATPLELDTTGSPPVILRCWSLSFSEFSPAFTYRRG